MGKHTVTYAIGFARCSPYVAEIRKKKRLLKDYRDNGKEISAARLAIEIGDLLLEDAELPDDTLSEEEFDNKVEKNLQDAIKYCTVGYRCLTAQSKPYTDTIRAMELLVEAYKRLEEYDDAIKYAKLLMARLREKGELTELRSAVKSLADIYFTRGHDLKKAKYDDYENARIFYMQEHALLEKLDEDTPDIADHRRSNLFNLGVIGGKFIGGDERAKEYLAKAIKGARELKDYRSELTTWWELGNLAKRRGDLELALRCKNHECQVIEKHKFKEELAPCLIEKVKLLIQFGDYNTCFKVCEQLKDIVDDEEDTDDNNMAAVVTRLAVSLQSIDETLKILPDTVDLSTVHTRGNLLLRKCQLEYEEGMFQAALASAEQGIAYVDTDPDIKRQLPRIRIGLMQVYANVLWYLREIAIDRFVDINNEILADIKLWYEDTRTRLEQLQQVYQRMVDVHYYFDQPEGYQRWKEILKEVDDALKEFADDEDDQMDDGASMDIDEAVGNMTLEDALPSPTTDARPLMIIRVLVSLETGDEQKEIHVPVDTDIRSIGWLKTKIPKFLWEKYGVEPRISRLHIDDRDLLSYEIITVVIKADDVVQAEIDGYTRKTPLEVYQNACQRLDIPAISKVEAVLSLEAPGALLLSSTGISSRDVPALKVVLRRLPFLHTLDISANLLCMKMMQMFAEILNLMPDLRYLDLKSNRLTSQSMAHLCKCCPLLESVDVSYNPLGAETMGYLPACLTQCRHLKRLELQYCDLGGYLRITDAIRAEYENARPCGACRLDLSDNGFVRLTVSKWKPLLSRLVEDFEQQVQL